MPGVNNNTLRLGKHMEREKQDGGCCGKKKKKKKKDSY
jgi:hypothetical protein